MSIILKGIDLPKGKDEALLLLVLGDGTVAEQISTNRYEEIADAEAIQIPKGHGRLIDEKEVKKLSHDVILGNGAKHRCIDTTRMYEAPTILESEEEDDRT